MALFALIPSYLSGTTRLILLVNFGGMIDIDMTFCKKILKGRSHMRPRMDFHLVLHGEYL